MYFFWQGLREVKIDLLTRNETFWKLSLCGTKEYYMGQVKQLERGIAGEFVLWRIGDEKRIDSKGIELFERQMWKTECGNKILVLLFWMAYCGWQVKKLIFATVFWAI